MADNRSFRIFRVITLWVTLGLVGFTLWISDGVTLGRWIAGGVLGLGFIQWSFLRWFEHQMAANLHSDLEEREPKR